MEKDKVIEIMLAFLANQIKCVYIDLDLHHFANDRSLDYGRLAAYKDIQAKFKSLGYVYK